MSNCLSAAVCQVLARQAEPARRRVSLEHAVSVRRGERPRNVREVTALSLGRHRHHVPIVSPSLVIELAVHVERDRLPDVHRQHREKAQTPLVVVDATVEPLAGADHAIAPTAIASHRASHISGKAPESQLADAGRQLAARNRQWPRAEKSRSSSGTLENSLATQGGLVIGTPRYMAPEMALSDNVDGRADLYSLGCVAYYLLTGRQVFEADTVMQGFAQHLQTAPIPPSQRGPVAVPRDLEQLVLNCLAKKPEGRPLSAGDLDRQLALLNVESWTNVHAQQWWAATQASSGVLDENVETREHVITPLDSR